MLSISYRSYATSSKARVICVILYGQYVIIHRVSRIIITTRCHDVTIRVLYTVYVFVCFITHGMYYML